MLYKQFLIFIDTCVLHIMLFCLVFCLFFFVSGEGM